MTLKASTLAVLARAQKSVGSARAC